MHGAFAAAGIVDGAGGTEEAEAGSIVEVDDPAADPPEEVPQPAIVDAHASTRAATSQRDLAVVRHVNRTPRLYEGHPPLRCRP